MVKGYAHIPWCPDLGIFEDDSVTDPKVYSRLAEGYVLSKAIDEIKMLSADGLIAHATCHMVQGTAYLTCLSGRVRALTNRLRNVHAKADCWAEATIAVAKVDFKVELRRVITLLKNSVSEASELREAKVDVELHLKNEQSLRMVEEHTAKEAAAAAEAMLTDRDARITCLEEELERVRVGAKVRATALIEHALVLVEVEEVGRVMARKAIVSPSSKGLPSSRAF